LKIRLIQILMVLLFCAIAIASKNWDTIPDTGTPEPPQVTESFPAQEPVSPDGETPQISSPPASEGTADPKDPTEGNGLTVESDSAETAPETPEQPEKSPEPDSTATEDSASEVIPEEPQSEEPQTAEPAPQSKKLPILMYHHVVPDGTTCNDMTVTESKLASDFQWLQDHGYEAILPSQLISDHPLPEKPILITFDDGYRSNYELAYPLLQQYGTKAAISVMVYMQDVGASSFLSWDMCREMANSGLVEIGSHTYLLHNLDERGGNFTPGGINGIQRIPEESDEDFKRRVLDDLQQSHDLIETNVGRKPVLFAYPFGIRETDAEALIDTLFPVTVVTQKGMADLSGGTQNLNRWTVTMYTDLSSILQS